MRSPFAGLVLVIALLVAVGGTARAQTNDLTVQIFTLEAHMMLSEVVVLGDIAEVDGRSVKVTAKETFRGPDNRSWDVIWVDGIPAAEVGRECLVFISPADDGLNHALHTTGCVPLDGSGRAYDISLREISDREALLSAARDMRDVTAPLVYVDVKSRSKEQPATSFIVPKIRKLETLAQEWLRSPEDHWQSVGLSTISHFRSPENLQRLNPLLSDTTFEYGFGSGRWKCGIYVERERALAVMKHWQEPTDQVSTDGPVVFHQPVAKDIFPPIAAALTLWVAGFAVAGIMWRRRAGLPLRLGSLLRNAITALLIAAALVLGLLWRRSHHVVDEVVFGAGNAHHEIASYRGGIQHVLVPKWEWDRQFRYGAFAATKPMKVANPFPRRPGAFRQNARFPRRLDFLRHHQFPQYRYGESPPEDAWDMNAYTLNTSGEKWGVRWGEGSEQTPGPLLNYRVVRIPYAWIVPLAAVLPLLRVPGCIRCWRRVRNGLCPQCGYDVRVTPDACPECGWQRRSKRSLNPKESPSAPQP